MNRYYNILKYFIFFSVCLLQKLAFYLGHFSCDSGKSIKAWTTVRKESRTAYSDVMTASDMPEDGHGHGVLNRRWSPLVSAGMLERPVTEYTNLVTSTIPRPRPWNTATTCSIAPPRPLSRHSIPGIHCTGWASWTTAPTPRSNRYLYWWCTTISNRFYRYRYD